ncbi:unnamed protein product [Gulo gulo]|uniref:Uncharacterized protein n=1 Tax=Gulo gulo TaxID=48420 RepID=A0A9X9M1U6_GULGU|nr:unnamed protein product [Gulo gulo]
MARQSHIKYSLDFLDKYANATPASRTTYCVVVWMFNITQIRIEWNLSPVGGVTTK